MSNMSYCRFENTSQDLQDCLENMDESMDDKSEHEIKGRKKLIKLCCDMALEYGAEIGRELIEL